MEYRTGRQPRNGEIKRSAIGLWVDFCAVRIGERLNERTPVGLMFAGVMTETCSDFSVIKFGLPVVFRVDTWW